MAADSPEERTVWRRTAQRSEQYGGEWSKGANSMAADCLGERTVCGRTV